MSSNQIAIRVDAKTFERVLRLEAVEQRDRASIVRDALAAGLPTVEMAALVARLERVQTGLARTPAEPTTRR